MYIDLEPQSKLEPYFQFDWRLVAERGLRCYGHFHSFAMGNASKTVATCEIGFLLKVGLEQQEEEAARSQQQRSDLNTPNLVANGSSKLSITSATRRTGQFKCVGAIRKAGFLSVKKWILKRRQSIELARRQGWKRYWVCLRGTSLLFHCVVDKRQQSEEFRDDENRIKNNGDDGVDENQTDLLSWMQANFANQLGMLENLLQNEQQQYEQNGSLSREALLKSMSQCYIEREPKHLIIIDGSIAQPIPEHPRRDFVFCLSTTFGDAYFFQAGCQLESDNWIAAIHNACAASIARDLTRDETIKLFDNKIRHLELEADKKLFLRQRLESRLTSTLSMGCHDFGNDALALKRAAHIERTPSDKDNNGGTKRTITMRSLLYQLSQQLLALDTYIEQVHCEVYQLRCYLSSCGAQALFYRNKKANKDTGSLASAQFALANELPHPKSLLMHVSKPTKLLLLKLGVFTVSSFHAFIHARQESAETLLQKICQQSDSLRQVSGSQQAFASPLELRIRSQSISEALLARPENKKLESETEELIELANLRGVRLQLSKDLFQKIRRPLSGGLAEHYLAEIETDTSDDRYSIRDGGEIVIINMKLNPKSNCLVVIKQVLEIIEPNSSELDFLDYYLRLVSFEQGSNAELEQVSPCSKNSTYQLDDEHLVVARELKLEDWPSFNYVELAQKIIYRIDVPSCMTDDEAALPFGISIEGQLFSGKFASLLDVYCSYIEWGSMAEKVGLREEDEFLMINGIPVADLDLMFVECLLQDSTTLRLVVRSSRSQCPQQAALLDKDTWLPPGGDGGDDDDDDDDDDDNDQDNDDDGHQLGRRLLLGPPDRGHGGGDGGGPSYDYGDGGSQVISDEYITSLVCPPPPVHSSAFLRTDQQLLRQRSDLGAPKVVGDEDEPEEYFGYGGRTSELLGDSFAETLMTTSKPKSKSQLQLDNDSFSCVQATDVMAAALVGPATTAVSQSPQASTDSCSLARQLLQRTERLTKMLGLESTNQEDGKELEKDEREQKVNTSVQVEAMDSGARGALHCKPSELDQNNVERLRKCLLELFETEYAYIKQLETVDEHYMVPLAEANFLNINDLKLFRQTLRDLLTFQRDFFLLFTTEIELVSNGKSKSSGDCDNDNNDARIYKIDDIERLNRIVQRLEEPSMMINSLEPMLAAICKIFTCEATGFKIYAKYCMAYSKLQKLLHPKGTSSSNLPCSSITSMPSSLNTFASTAIPSLSGLTQQREHHLSKPMSQLIPVANSGSYSLPTGSHQSSGVGHHNAQYKQLAEFLSNLDSSSSSFSYNSLARSSSTLTACASFDKETVSKRPTNIGTTSSQKSGSSVSLASEPQLQAVSNKNVHHQQNFESYLIKPIQRIVKYPMLLNSIDVAAKAVFNSCDVQQQQQQVATSFLKEAVKQMEVVICEMNNSQRIYDEFGPILEQIERLYYQNGVGGGQSVNQLMLDQQLAALRMSANALQPVLSSGPHQPPVSLDISQLLYFGPVDWLNVAEFATTKTKKSNLQLNQVLFVFSSCVVFMSKEQVKLSNRKLLPSLRSSESIASAQSSRQSANNQITTSNFASKLMQKPSDLQCTEIIRYQTLIPVSEVQVRSVPLDSRGGGNKIAGQTFCWELFQCSSSNSNSSLLTANKTNQSTAQAAANVKRNASAAAQKSNKNNTGRVYQLACHTNEERSAFLRKIRFIIRESVRNMNLPLARTPSSRSFNSKKLSSPTDTSSAAISVGSSSSLEEPKRHSNTTNATTTTTGSSCSQASNCRSKTDSSCALGMAVVGSGERMGQHGGHTRKSGLLAASKAAAQQTADSNGRVGGDNSNPNCNLNYNNESIKVIN